MEFALDAHEAVNRTIGPYKLLQQIGEGGFGVVWMAEQQTPVRRRVALKIIKRGMDSREVIARFEVERQALALMDHPNIARVLDAGETDSGRPFFVMELVRGISITKYCDDHQLPTHERLRLFMAVCHAVQHAHQKGVIHRDLKPSNILVTRHDGEPVPKVIDFGIAKATESRLSDKTLFTQFHAFLGTPAYTSPEQMEMGTLDIDTRSDIYSLGVLLYELLAGRPPFDPDELLKSGLEAMRLTIREKDPPRPSLRLTTLGEELRRTVAQQRSTDPAKLSVQLRGDLDWIVMRCLEKNRTRRYETAASLAADVRRHLTHEPVTARPPSVAYRAQKFIHRHKLGFTVSAVTVGSLIGALVLVAAMLSREQTARGREHQLREQADANAEQARVAAATSAQVAQFMKDMLSGVGPTVALGRDTALLREILDKTTRRLDAELRDQPAVAADLRHALGNVYRDLNEYVTAELMLREAVAARRTLTNTSPAQLASVLDDFGVVLVQLNKAQEAEAVLQEALGLRRELHGDSHPAVADTLSHLASVSNPTRSMADVEAMRREVLRIRRQTFGESHPAVADALAQLAAAAIAQFDREKALLLQREALAMRRAHLERDHPAIAESLGSLGFTLDHLGSRAEAAAAFREAFTIRRKMLGDRHPQVMVALLRFVGSEAFAGISDESVLLVREFISSQRKSLPAGSPLLAPSLQLLAIILDRPGRNPPEAQTLAREAQGLFEVSRTNGPPLEGTMIAAMDYFGWSKFVAGEPADGLGMSAQAMNLTRAMYRWNQREAVQPARTLAWILLSLRRMPEAAAAFEEALRSIRAVLGDDHIFAQIDVAGLGAAYREAGRMVESRQLLEAALNRGERSATARSYQALLWSELGLTLQREGQLADAEHAFRTALARYNDDGIHPLSHRLRPRERAMSALGRMLAARGAFAEGEALVVQAFVQLESNYEFLSGDRAGLLRDALEAVVETHVASGKTDQAAEWRQRLAGRQRRLNE